MLFKMKMQIDTTTEMKIIHLLSSFSMTEDRKTTGSATVFMLKKECFLICPLLFTFHVPDSSAQGMLKTEDYSSESCNRLINANRHSSGSHHN